MGIVLNAVDSCGEIAVYVNVPLNVRNFIKAKIKLAGHGSRAV
jgi:hypothetical protein